MTAPPIILQPPTMSTIGNSNELYKFLTEIWSRTGGYTASPLDIKDLKATAGELNTLIGIDTTYTVQTQLNNKVNLKDIGTIARQNYNAVEITGGTLTGTVQTGNSYITAAITSSTFSSGAITSSSFGSGTITNTAITGGTINGAAITGGSISGATITFPTGSATTIVPRGTLSNDQTTHGTIGALEQTLATQTILANTLTNSLNYLEVYASGTVAANGNNKEIKLKIGTNVIYDSGAVAANSGSWFIHSVITVIASDTLKCITTMISDNALIVNVAKYYQITQDITANFDILITAQGTNDGDIVQEGFIINWSK